MSEQLYIRIPSDRTDRGKTGIRHILGGGILVERYIEKMVEPLNLSTIHQFTDDKVECNFFNATSVSTTFVI